MKKEKILKWIENSVQSLADERDYNEISYKDGENPEWISKENGNLFQPMTNYWGYMSLIWQLENIKKLINEGEFDE